MIRFVSIVSPDFWPGFAALQQSLEENSSLAYEECEILLLCDVKTAPAQWLAGRRMRIQLLDLGILPRIGLLSPQNQGGRMEGALQKLALFTLPQEWGRCVFIDSDMICLGDLRPLQDMQPLTAASDQLDGLGWASNPAIDRWPEINTGLMVFEPSSAMFEELHSVYQRRHRERTHKGDQDVINMWLEQTGRPITRLTSEWNFSKRFQDKTGVRWVRQRIKQIKILHFVGQKPWTRNSEINTFRECHYAWMEAIWWDYFGKSGLAQHLKDPPRRSTAVARRWLLPWTKPVILREHLVRAMRLARRVFRGGSSSAHP